MKLGVVANCQSQPLSRMLEVLPGVERVSSLPVHLQRNPKFNDWRDAFMEVAADPAATVLTFQLSEDFGEISTHRLRANSKARVVSMTNVFFSGLHPDITYLGGMGGRVKSPLGDYHSRIVLSSFLEGLAEKECLERFNHSEYERRGFYGEFDRSAAELARRSESLDIDFSESFLRLARQRPSLYTVNHPTAVVFAAYVEQIADFLGLDPVSFPVEFLPNYLGNSAWWPVYDPIASRLNLPYRTPQYFRQPEAGGGKLLSLPRFVLESYAIYRQHEEAVRNTPQAKAILSQNETGQLS